MPVLDARPLQDRLLCLLQESAARLRERGVVPTFGALTMEGTPTGAWIEEWCQRTGVRLSAAQAPRGAERQVLERLKQYAQESRVQGIWLSPDVLREYAALALPLRLPPEKELNRLHPHNLGMLAWLDQRPRFPPEVEALGALIDPELAGKKVCLLGSPGPRRQALAARLEGMAQTLCLCNPEGDLPLYLRLAEVLVVLDGPPLSASLLRPGCLLVDTRASVPAMERAALEWGASAYFSELEPLEIGFALQGLLETCLRLLPAQGRPRKEFR